MKFEQIKKSPKKVVEEKLHEILIEDIGEEYRILWESDDGGNHVVVAFEEFCPPITKTLLPGDFMGWRLIRKICPAGYLEAFYPIKEDG
jgi:hypothetical protein